MTKHTFADRMRTHWKAKNKLGLKQGDAQDKYTFMQECISELVDSGDAEDEGDARDICDLLWSEGSDLFDN